MLQQNKALKEFIHIIILGYSLPMQESQGSPLYRTKSREEKKIHECLLVLGHLPSLLLSMIPLTKEWWHPQWARLFPHQLRGVNKALSHRHTHRPTWPKQSPTETFSDSILSSQQLNTTTRTIVSAVKSTDCFQRIQVQFPTPTYKSAPNSSVNTSWHPLLASEGTRHASGTQTWR